MTIRVPADPAEQILHDTARAVAGQRGTIARYHAATAADVLDAIAASEAFTRELVARVGGEATDGVRDLLGEAANAHTRGWAF